MSSSVILTFSNPCTGTKLPSAMCVNEYKGSSLLANLALRPLPRYEQPAPLSSNANSFIPFNSMLKNKRDSILPTGLLTIKDLGANTWHFVTFGVSPEDLAAASDLSQLPPISTFREGVVRVVDGGESIPLFVACLGVALSARLHGGTWHATIPAHCGINTLSAPTTHLKARLTLFTPLHIVVIYVESIFTLLAVRPLLWLRRSGRLLRVFLESALSARPGRFWAASCGVVDTGATSIVAESSREVLVRLDSSIPANFPELWVFGGTYAEDGNDDSASEGGGW